MIGASDIDVQIQLELVASDGFVDVSADVVQDQNIKFKYGIMGAEPRMRVASGGSLDFVLDNDITNSAATKGYYSPTSTDVRTGFAEGINARLAIVYGSDTYYKWRGRLTKIEPKTGAFGERITKCRGTDWIADSIILKPEGVAVQVDQTADELLTTALAAVTNQPAATSFNTGKSTFAYAFDEMRDGRTTMMQVMKNIALSELGYVAEIGDTTQGGTLTLWNRHNRVVATDILITLDESISSDDFDVLNVVDDERNIFNDIRCTVYPRVVDSAASDQILWTYQGDDPSIAPGASQLFIGRYTDCDSPGTRISATAVITPEQGVDYISSGADSDIGVSATLGGNTIEVTVTNNGASVATITTLQVRGKRVLIYEPAIAESTDSDSIASFGDRPLRLSLKYQNKITEGQDFADIIKSRWKDEKLRAKSVSFSPNRSVALLTAFLDGEPSDRIALTEEIANYSAGEYFINGVAATIKPTHIIDATWYLAEGATESYWILNTSKLDTETILGF